MDSTISISFRYSELDYVRALRAHYASRLRLKLDVVVALGAALLGVYLWQSNNSRSWGIGLVCLSAVFALMLAAAFAVMPKLIFRREPKFLDEYSLAFSQDGIHFRTNHIDSQLQWSMYDRALIDHYSFVLYYGNYSFSVIPKRVFESPAQLAAFEQLISEKIPLVSKKSS